MNATPIAQPQFNLGTLLLMVAMFALGLVAREFAGQFRPATAPAAVLPASTSPVAAGEVLLIESAVAPELNRRVTVLSDFTISLPLLGDQPVGKATTVRNLEKTLNKKYSSYFKNPSIEVHREVASEPVR